MDHGLGLAADSVDGGCWWACSLLQWQGLMLGQGSVGLSLFEESSVVVRMQMSNGDNLCEGAGGRLFWNVLCRIYRLGLS